MFNFDDVGIGAWELILTIVLSIAVVALIAIINYLFRRKRGLRDTVETRDLTYGAVCIALSFTLSFFGYTLPQGGTVTPASILPIMLYCYYFGFSKGAVVCSVYMILQLFQRPYIITPWSAVLDYILPYLALSFTGLFRYNPDLYNKTLIAERHVITAHYPLIFGGVMYAIVRYSSHVLAGIIFYAEWTPDSFASPLAYSLVYNSFCLIDFALAFVAAFALLSSRTFNTFMSAKQYGRVASQRDALQNTYTGTKDD